MADEKLRHESMRIFGCLEASREIGIATEQPITLWVYVQSICGCEPKPTPRINANASQHVDWVVLKSVRCASSDVMNRLELSDWLKPLINREVKANARNKFIRPIQ
jgi:hypothetical protein